MKIAVDTNILIRAAVRDDPAQTKIADRTLMNASGIVVSLPVFCEFAWVVGSVYKFSSHELSLAIETLLNISKLITSRPAVEAGLQFLQAGRDFADGVIAFEGKRLGADTFVSFDKKAVSFLMKSGFQARLAD